MSKKKRSLTAEMALHEKQQRLRAYEVYRDMGSSRTHDRLIIVLEKTHGLLPKRRISVWSKEDRWSERIAEYDRATNPSDHLPAIITEVDFDRTDMLLRAAHLALTRVLASHPTIRTPQDYKTLVDAAEKSIRLVEKLRELGVEHGKPGDVDRRSTLAQKMLKELRDAVAAKFEAMGTPIPTHGQIIDITPDKVEVVSPEQHGSASAEKVEIPDGEVEIPEVEDVMVEKPALDDAPKPKTMAERLAALQRRS